MSILQTEYPKFIQSPFQVQSGWKKYEFPTQISFKGRILYKVITETGQQADPLLLQVQNAFGFVCPQGYQITKIHFCNGIAIGAWIQHNPDYNPIYISSYSVEKTIQELLVDVIEPVQEGVFGFGGLSQNVINDQLTINIPGVHTTIKGIINLLPNTVTIQVANTQFKQPVFQQSQQDGSQLIGVFKVFNDIIYIYGYQYDVQALSRIYALDNHNIIKQTVSILNQSSQEIQSVYGSLFKDLLFFAFTNDILAILTADQQQVAISNATLYINGQRQFPGITLQGNDSIKDQMTSICTNPLYSKYPICSCYQSAVHPCLSPICQQAGYKTQEIQQYDCQKELKGMTINLQNCIMYNQQVAGGSISGDQNIQQSCTQQIGNAGLTVKQTESDNTSKNEVSQSYLLGFTGTEVILYGLLLFIILIIVLYILWVLFMNHPNQITNQNHTQLHYQHE